MAEIKSSGMDAARQAVARAWQLPHRALLVLRDVAGSWLSCEQGQIWLSESNGEEIVLRPGMRYQIRSAGDVVLSALAAASGDWRRSA